MGRLGPGRGDIRERHHCGLEILLMGDIGGWRYSAWTRMLFRLFDC